VDTHYFYAHPNSLCHWLDSAVDGEGGMIYQPSDLLDWFLSTYCYRLRYWLGLGCLAWPDWYPAIVEATGGAYGKLGLNDVRRVENL
jgi:hypothetical protein